MSCLREGRSVVFDCDVPPVVLNAFAPPVELEAGVITVSAPRVASLPNWSFSVAVMSPLFTPAVLDEAPVRTMWSRSEARRVGTEGGGRGRAQPWEMEGD